MASQRGKTGKDPSASESEMLPCLGFGADVARLGHREGNGAELEQSPHPSCSCAGGTSLLALGSAPIPQPPKTGTLQHRRETNTRNVQLFSQPASNSCWINAVY